MPQCLAFDETLVINSETAISAVHCETETSETGNCYSP